MKVPWGPRAKSPYAAAARSSPCTPSDTPVGLYFNSVTGVLTDVVFEAIASEPAATMLRSAAPISFER